MAVTGLAMAARLAAEGFRVVGVDDLPNASVRDLAAQSGATLLEAPSTNELAGVVARADLVVASPGVPPYHPLFSLGVPVIGDIEFASRRASVPILAITGTAGKTTVTTLVTSMLVASGRRAMAAGNIGVPLVNAIATDAEILVVEVSSFQLSLTDSFHPRVAVWLNVAENHLDWHRDMDEYVAAKAKIWANCGDGDTVVVNAEDSEVMATARSSPVVPTTFGLNQGDYRLVGRALCLPNGEVVAGLDELPRRRPHDVANALAAVATAHAAGAGLEACHEALVSFAGLPHRVEPLGEAGGVEYYNDSKATTPSAVLAALSGFDSVVLIAGGRNKGVSLAPLAQGAGVVRAVVAIGEAAPEVEDVFAPLRPVAMAHSMDEAVQRAADLARPGDAVLLSPGCASFDWYRSYEERGDDFKRAVGNLFRHAKEAT